MTVKMTQWEDLGMLRRRNGGVEGFFYQKHMEDLAPTIPSDRPSSLLRKRRRSVGQSGRPQMRFVKDK